MSPMMKTVERYLAPTSLAQALAALADSGGVTVLAGGTDLMPQSRAGRVRPARTLLNIRRVPGLGAIEVVGDRLRLGALATIAELLVHPLVRQHAPLLSEAADHFASDQIRNAATLGGNVCNASPAGDMLGPLLALDAEVELVSLADGGSMRSRRLPLEGFFAGPGARGSRPTNCSRPCCVLPAPRGQVARFYKTGTRPALDISTISIAFAARERRRRPAARRSPGARCGCADSAACASCRRAARRPCSRRGVGGEGRAMRCRRSDADRRRSRHRVVSQGTGAQHDTKDARRCRTRMRPQGRTKVEFPRRGTARSAKGVRSISASP